MVKTDIFRTSRIPKSISRKNLNDRKILKFSLCVIYILQCFKSSRSEAQYPKHPKILICILMKGKDINSKNLEPDLVNTVF